MRLTHALALAAATVTLTGCRSAYIEATVSNGTPGPISLLEVDYPSASFGTQSLAAGADFHYRFKVLGSGPIQVLWTDVAHRDHKGAGPVLHENQEGSILITIAPDGANWDDHLLER